WVAPTTTEVRSMLSGVTVVGTDPKVSVDGAAVVLGSVLDCWLLDSSELLEVDSLLDAEVVADDACPEEPDSGGAVNTTGTPTSWLRSESSELRVYTEQGAETQSAASLIAAGSCRVSLNEPCPRQEVVTGP